MDTSYGDWQPGHLKLQAPELYVLLHKGTDAKPTEVLKVAILELIGRGVVRPATQLHGTGRATTRSAVLVRAAEPTAQPDRSLQSLMEAYDAVPKRAEVDGEQGVAVRDLAHELRARHGGKLENWVADEVLATLVERGLYTKEQGKRLLIFDATRYEPTAEGNAARALLEESIARAESEFGDWADDDPRRASTFVALAGSAVLLMPGLHAPIQRFRKAVHPGHDVAATDAAIVDAGQRDFDIQRLQDHDYDLDAIDTDVDYGGDDWDAGDGGDGGASD